MTAATMTARMTDAAADRMTILTNRVRLLTRAAALAAVLTCAAACSSETSTSSSLVATTSSATTTTKANDPTTAATTPAVAPEDANGALQQGLATLAAGYHFSSTVTVNGALSLTADGDRISDSSSLVLSGPGGTVSYIVTPEGSYAQPEAGEWTLLDLAPATSDPIAALLRPVSTAVLPTSDGTVVVQVTVTAVSLGITADGNVDVQVLLADGAITQITYTAPVDGGTAQVVTTISTIVDTTPIVAPI